MAAKPKYVMKISRLTVDKLGVKLYDKVSAVIAELVANSYDADATEVVIRAPMGEYLASRHDGKTKDKGYSIEISDNGNGMTTDEVNKYYLKVGAERRSDERGDRSKRLKRKVMGRKGVGKLAPFGICRIIEVVSHGGTKTNGKGSDGKQRKGYVTSDLILDRDGILKDEDFDYEPSPGPLDNTIAPACGTKVSLRHFAFRRVPTMSEFARQLAQRFGIQSPDWKIVLIDSLKTEDDPQYREIVGAFAVTVMANTRITFSPKQDGEIAGQATDESAKVLEGVEAGFEYEGKRYPIRGWVGYSKEPYKDDLMAGVRIYCRGKIAAQTSVFNQGAGFHGEYSVRSYLVGELHADWLDQEEDLINTDRRDIMWSHELGQKLEEWGRDVVKKIASMARNPLRKKVWDRLIEASRLKERILEEFPSDDQSSLRQNTLDVAKMIGQTFREDEIQDEERVEEFVQLSLMLGPVVALDEKLRAAADATDSPLEAVTELLKTAQIAELTAFGRIAQDRVRVIQRVEALKDDPDTLEDAFQKLIETSPWLVDPQWSPITANESFQTVRKEFVKFYRQRTGKDINLENFSDPSKRIDFVMSSQDNNIQIVEIKKPGHKIANEELDRIITYRTVMEEFLEKEGNKEFAQLFSGIHITLVCDGIALTGARKDSFDRMKEKGQLTHHSWSAFLLRTRKTHQSFLETAAQKRKRAAKT